MIEPNSVYTITGLTALLIIETGKGIRAYYQSKKNNDKKNDKKTEAPGKADICIERGKRVAVMENELGHINNNLISINKKLYKIDKGINGE